MIFQDETQRNFSLINKVVLKPIDFNYIMLDPELSEVQYNDTLHHITVAPSL